jgi:hypothetical protein
MTVKTASVFVAAGLIAAASFATAQAAPSAPGASTLELSAQQDNNKKKKANKGNQQQNNPGAQGGGNKFGGGKQNNLQGVQKQGVQNTNKNMKQNNPQAVQGNQKKFGNGNGKQNNQMKVISGGGGGSSKSGANKNAKVIVVQPKTKIVVGKRMRGLPGNGGGKFFVKGKNYSTWRGANYRIRYHNAWRTFVPLTALAVLAVGPRHYYPYAYIAAPRPYCEGYTEDGCLLDWREVETLEGDILAQCVAYCPWQEY